MEKTRLEFLKRYMDTICPTGFEEEAARVWRAEAESFADRTWVDQMGNAFAVVNEGGSPRVMLAGHADEIGLQIVHVDEKGFIYFRGLGGWDVQVLPGQRVQIKTASGALPGVIGRKAVHRMTPEDRKKVVKMEDLWIDIGAKDRDEVFAQGIQIGDPAVVNYGYQELLNGYVVARAFDDRIGAFIVLEAARMLSEMNPNAAVYAVATTQEEIGVRGATTSAFGIDPDVGIAVDVSNVSDTPDTGSGKKQFGEGELGKGPIVVRGPNINTKLFEHLMATAKGNDIPVQVNAYPRPTGTDARAIQVTRSGVPTALIGVPNRYMHSPNEVVHLEDVTHCIELIAHGVGAITAETSFIPE